MILSKTELESQLEEADRQQGKDSLFYLCRFILGYDQMEIRPHAEVCSFIESILHKYKRGLDLEPRGSFKTTQISQGLPIFLLLRDPNLRILLDSAVLQNSIDNLGVIKRHFESNERLRFLYGDYVGGYWVTEEVTIRQRTKNLKEPSIRCASAERVQVGPHYDVIIADDLVSKENSRSPDGRRQVKEHFRLLFSLLEPKGILIIVGTRWHYDDLYGLIKDEFKDFASRVMPAILPEGELYFPSRLTKPILDEIKVHQGRDIFNCQYLNDPSPEDDDATFKRTYFKAFEKLPENKNTYLTIDPGGKDKGSDDWAFMTGHIDPQGFKYFDNLVKGHYKASEAMDVVFNQVTQLGIKIVGLEVTGAQKWLLEMIYDEMRRRALYFTVIPLTHSTDSKEVRIKRLQPQYEAGTIFHSSRMGPLEEQLMRFPKGKDDVADVASMLLEIMQAPRSARAKREPPKTLDEWFIRQHRDQERKPRQHALLGDQW